MSKVLAEERIVSEARNGLERDRASEVEKASDMGVEQETCNEIGLDLEGHEGLLN